MRIATRLSVLIAILAAGASAGGLLIPGLYRDNLFVVSAWKGNDLVTLLFAVPLLVISLARANKGSIRAGLVWLGILDYMLYNYAFYLFGSAFNWFFLVYVALFGLSIFALIYGLSGLDLARLVKSIDSRMRVRWIAGYMIFVATGLSVIYLGQTVGFILTNTVPPIVTQSAHPTSIVFALDLTLLVPFLALGAIWLLRRKPWGYVLAGVTTVKGALYTLVLASGSLWASQAGVEGVVGQIPLWLGLTALGLAAAGVFSRGVRQEREKA